MTEVYRKILIAAGYDCAATRENVINCFLDYVDTGAFGNLSYDEALEDIEDGEITIDQICSNLLRILR